MMKFIKHIWTYWTDPLYRFHVDFYNKRFILDTLHKAMQDAAKMQNTPVFHGKVSISELVNEPGKIEEIKK